MALDNDINSAEGLYKKPVAAEGVYYFFLTIASWIGYCSSVENGAFLIESLSFSLAKKAWSHFQ